jgi:hypothetical protein
MTEDRLPLNELLHGRGRGGGGADPASAFELVRVCHEFGWSGARGRHNIT